VTTEKHGAPKTETNDDRPKTPVRETVVAKLEKTLPLEMMESMEIFQKMGISPKANTVGLEKIDEELSLITRRT
jgi:hypothetical protein